MKNRGRGYLHPVNSLDYKLKIRNTADRPLRLFVSHGLEGLSPYNDSISIEGGQVRDVVVGTVSPTDLPDDGAVRNLKVRITEEDADGRRLAKDLVVPFQKVEPTRADIGTAVTYNNGYLTLDVNHSTDDRVTAPALVYVKIEPFEAVRQVDRDPVVVPLGERVRFVYYIDRTIPKVKWTLIVDEVVIKSQEEVINRSLEKPPGGAGAGAASDAPGGANGPGGGR